MIATAIGLLFYANMIAFDLFVLPVFSIYAAIAGAVTLTIITIAIALIEKRTVSFPIAQNVPLIGSTKETKGVMIGASSPANIGKNRNFDVSKIEEQKNQPTAKPILQLVKQSATKAVIQSKVDENIPINKVVEASEREDMLTCLSCLKDFSQPIQMSDYSDPNQPKIVEYCPYCDHPLDPRQKRKDTFKFDKEKQEDSVIDPNTDKDLEISQEAELEEKDSHIRAVVQQEGMFTCPKCSKEFSQPIFMADYSEPNHPQLIGHCPYCDQSLGSKQESTTVEAVWKKYV